jgi:hypothetical protein
MLHSKLLRLALAAVAALALALWVGRSREPAEQVIGDQPLVAGLSEGLNDLKSVRLVGAEDKPIVTLERGDKGWTVKEKGYAADILKVREYLLKLADARLVEAKTANPELHAKLGVEDLKSADAKGVRLEIDGLKEPARLIIGNYNGRGGDGTFVRRDGDPQAWLAKGNLSVDKVAANWLKRDLTDIASSRIREVRIASGGKTLRAYKDDAAQPNYKLADVPKGREATSEFVANGLASVPSGLRFDDVVESAEIEPGDAKRFEIDYEMFDGLVVHASAWEKDGKDYARFRAELDEAKADAAVTREQERARREHEARKAEAEAAAAAAAEAAKAAAGGTTAGAEKPDPAAAAPAPEAPLAVTDPAKDREQRLEALRKEAAELNARFDGWTFVIPNFKYANMNKGMDEMLKPLETKK